MIVVQKECKRTQSTIFQLTSLLQTVPASGDDIHAALKAVKRKAVFFRHEKRFAAGYPSPVFFV